MVRIQKIFIITIFIATAYLGACPFIMVNDSKQAILIVDIYNKQAVRILPGRSANIDPALHGWRRYFRQETIDVYVEHQHNKNSFERYYRFTEKYCPIDGNKIALSTLQNLAKNPTDSTRVQSFIKK